MRLQDMWTDRHMDRHTDWQTDRWTDRLMDTDIWTDRFLNFFLEFDFCRFSVVIWFFHPRHNGQWPQKDLWYDAVLDWGLNPGPPALEASTLPLGYRGGAVNLWFRNICSCCICVHQMPVLGLNGSHYIDK